MTTHPIPKRVAQGLLGAGFIVAAVLTVPAGVAQATSYSGHDRSYWSDKHYHHYKYKPAYWHYYKKHHHKYYYDNKRYSWNKPYSWYGGGYYR